MTPEVRALVDGARLVCWDFDGVIKESVQIKTEAFHRLFLPFGAAVAARVREHHLGHGGMSRYQKIPLYLQWAGLDPAAGTVDEYCRRFADSVEDAVVACAWVPGSLQLLRGLGAARCVLVTATPQDEIESILERLAIQDCFHRVFGAPTAKADGIRQALGRLGAAPSQALMIGDSKEDLKAASACGVPFLLRRTPENIGSMTDYNGVCVPAFE